MKRYTGINKLAEDYYTGMFYWRPLIHRGAASMLMKQRNARFASPLFYLLFIFLVSEPASAQGTGLVLNPEDMRLEWAYVNGDAGYSLFVRKKQGAESVMLTEPSGYYALRSTEWNEINGNERRELSGTILRDSNSRFSIVSSTPVPDSQFGRAFQLFIPSRVVYGNPSSPAGTASLNMRDACQINIRTFDHKFADPNTGRFQNNVFLMSDINGGYGPMTDAAPAQSASVFRDLESLRSQLKVSLGTSDAVLNSFNNDDALGAFLRDKLIDNWREQLKRQSFE